MTYEISPIPPTPNRSSGRAIRSGGIVAACLVLVVGAAVAFSASSAPRTTAGADSSASAATRSAAPSAKSGDGDRTLGDGKLFRGAGLGTITITSINGSKIGLKTADGWTRTIDVGADTKVLLGSLAGKVGDLAVGNEVRLRQKKNADGSFSVVSLTVPAAKASGEVTAVTRDTITIKRRGGSTTTVTVNNATVYRQGGDAATKADVKVGSNISAEGKPGSSDNFTATAVKISLSRVTGEVTAKTATTITVKQRDGKSVVIHVDADTRYLVRVANGTKATLANVDVGNRLVATGVRRGDGSLDAIAVGAGKAKQPKTVKPVAPPASAKSG